jgi:hypothetical protein
MCPLGLLMLGSTLQDPPSDSPAHADQPAAEGEPRCAPAPTNERSSRAPAYPGRPRGRAGHCPTISHDDGQVQPTPRLAQHRLRQLRARGADSGRPRAGHGPSGRPRRPRPSSRTAACPRRAPGPHFGRTQRTRQRTDTGRRHRTPDSGHWTPVPWTGKRGHWPLAPDTTLDTGRWPRTWTGVTTARPASGPPGPPRRATARWDAQPCSCGRRLRRSTAHAGSAVRPPSSAR